jgi:fucose 4-O-acetylase-like acetyltransferase
MSVNSPAPTLRDFSIDIIKGLGCILMVMAHMPFKMGFYKYLTFVGGFAPVLFFSAAGITAAFQAQKYQTGPVLSNYFFLFFLGFALNGFHSPDYLHTPPVHFDMISNIALCSIIVYLLEHYLKPSTWMYLLMGISCFLIKLGFDLVLPVEGHPWLSGTLLSHVGAFPIFPWLFLYFLGVFAYRISISSNFVWAVTTLTIYLFLGFTGLILDYRSKYDMSVGYFLLSCLLLFVLFSLVRKFAGAYELSSGNILFFLGRNSLLFLFTHFAVIRILSGRLQLEINVMLFKHYPFMFWILILSITLMAMTAFIYASHFTWIQNQFNKIWIWILLVVLVIIIPALLMQDGLIRWAELGLGIIVGLYYQYLRAALLSVNKRAALLQS